MSDAAVTAWPRHPLPRHRFKDRFAAGLDFDGGVLV